MGVNPMTSVLSRFARRPAGSLRLYVLLRAPLRAILAALGAGE